MEKKPNLYMSVYKNIESEILSLTNSIHFCDNQLGVFSLKISDLLIRCVVEIESIAKDLYKDNINCKNFPMSKDMQSISIGKIITEIVDLWNLDKKMVSIISSNMYFSDINSAFCPFNYKTGDTNDYVSTYNSVKHDRRKSFCDSTETHKPTLHYLIRALSSLFLLNIYYENRIVYREGQLNIGSEIFSAMQADATAAIGSFDTAFNVNPIDCSYYRRYEKYQYDFLVSERSKLFLKYKPFIVSSQEYKLFCEKNPSFVFNKMDDVTYFGNLEYLQKCGYTEYISQMHYLQTRFDGCYYLNRLKIDEQIYNI